MPVSEPPCKRGSANGLFPGQPMTAHGGVPDPAEARGTPAEIARLQRCLSNARSPYRHFHVTAGARARSSNTATQALRNRQFWQSGRTNVKGFFAECLGTASLLAAVVGSGIMAAKLAGGNGALALLCNTLPTGAILVVLILALGPVSGAHFNPVVTLAFLLRGDVTWRPAALYVACQVMGG